MSLSNGQISLEFLLIIALVFALIASVSAPLAHQARLYSEDIAKVSEMRISLETIVTAADIVGATGVGARRTVRVHFPNVTILKPELLSVSKNISFEVELSDGAKTLEKTSKYFIKGSSSFSQGLKLNDWRDIIVECKLNATGLPIIEIRI